MNGRKKAIKKPKFIITYAISFLIILAVLTCVGILLYLLEDEKYSTRVKKDAIESEYRVEESLYEFIQKDKEDITGKDIAELKDMLVNLYSRMGVYTEVRYDGQTVVDSRRTIILDYYLPEYKDNELKKKYAFEIADEKYIEYFNTPEVNRFLIYYDEGYEGDGEGFTTHPYIEFYCHEFYIDYENYKFIPVLSSIITIGKNAGEDYEIRITPDPKDIEGFTLVKCPDEFDAVGCKSGFEGELNRKEIDKLVPLYENNNKFAVLMTEFNVKSFYEAYNFYIKMFALVSIVCALVLALVPASIRYNINKRNYEIFQYRLKTTNAMAHDLKTPLASIIAYAEILNNKIDADNREHYLTKLSDTASKMNSIVNSILQFSRSENAEVPVNKSEVSAPELIAAVINENEQQLNEKGLTTDFDSSEELKLNTDKELLHQALGNLINNAAKYAKEGTIVRIKYDEEMISITNETAETIEDITNIKDPFIKGNSSRQNGGTGLGLAIANNDLAMLGYKLDIRCEGDVFTATIKLRK